MDENNNESFNCPTIYDTFQYNLVDLQILKTKIEKQKNEIFYKDKANILENQLLYFELEKTTQTFQYEEILSNLKQKISILEEKLRLKSNEAEEEKKLRLEYIKQLNEQHEYISKMELDKSVMECHLAEMEQNINDLTTQNIQLNSKINELNSVYSKYFHIENENKMIFDVFNDIEMENSDFSLSDEFDEQDTEHFLNKYKSLVKIFFSQKRVLNKVETEYKQKNKEYESQIEKLTLQNQDYMIQFQDIQRKNWSLINELKTTTEFRDMALEHSQKMEEKLESFKYALTDEYKKSMKEFYRELNNCIDTLVKLVNYSQDVFNNKSKSIMDVSQLNTPTIFDEKKWDANLLFKKDFWSNETKKLKDLKRNYIDIKIKYNLIALTDID